MRSYPRVYLSKKQHKKVIVLLTFCFIGFMMIDWFGSWFFNFEISRFLSLAITLAFALVILGVNLIYYRMGEGSADRDRSDSLYRMIGGLVFTILFLGLLLWYGQ